MWWWIDYCGYRSKRSKRWRKWHSRHLCQIVTTIIAWSSFSWFSLLVKNEISSWKVFRRILIQQLCFSIETFLCSEQLKFQQHITWFPSCYPVLGITWIVGFVLNLFIWKRVVFESMSFWESAEESSQLCCEDQLEKNEETNGRVLWDDWKEGEWKSYRWWNL